MADSLRTLLETLRPEFYTSITDRSVYYRTKEVLEQGVESVKFRVNDHKENIEKLLTAAIRLSREELSRFSEKLPDASDASLVTILKETKERGDQIHSLRRQLNELQEDLEKLTTEFERDMSDFRKFCGFEDLSSWAEKIKSANENLMTVVSTVSFFGATITYSTIFSSIRGNVGLMCWAFALFNVGYIIPVASHALLPIHALKLKGSHVGIVWRLLVRLAAYISLSAVVTAIYLLNVSIFELYFSTNPQTGELQDSPLKFDISPRSAAILTFAVASTAALAAFSFFLYYVLPSKSKREQAGHCLDNHFSSLARAYV